MMLNTQLKSYTKNLLKKQFVLMCSVLAIASQCVSPVAYAGSKAPNPTTGNFVSVEHPTVGQAHIIKDGIKRYLVLDKAFHTDAGPDLFVILHRAAVPKTYAPKDYVLLGKLQRTSGQQRYEIPANIDPSAYRSVAIWCRQFSATFGYAQLTHGKM
jgi:hypothetical protein